MNYDIYGLIKDIADKNINLLLEQGHAEAGNNGAYNCNDTPCRNSAHWCVTYSYLYEKSKELMYYECVVILGDYLVNEIHNTKNNTVCCMTDSRFDSINGLIGQAWVIEGLVSAALTTKDEKYYIAAKKLFFSQKFNSDTGQWERIDINNENLGYDIAFNHQVWFAAAGALICQYKNDSEIKKMVYEFLDKCEKHFIVRRNGLIVHFGDREIISVKGRIKKIIKLLLRPIARHNPDKFDINVYEASYQLFNLYGFGLIKEFIGKHPFFENEKFKEALQCGLNIDKLNEMLYVNNKNKSKVKFAYAYNSPAFEYPYVAKIFDGANDNIDKIDKLLNIQMDYYSEEEKKFIYYTCDPETLTARIYELTRFIGREQNKE